MTDRILANANPGNCWKHGIRYAKSTADRVSDYLGRIELAVRWRKPAVIGSHRRNYIGSLRPANREQDLRLLRQLLREIVHHWPHVEFLSSDELGDIMNAEP